MRELYVYYKVSPADEAAVLDIVLAAQRGLMQRFEGLSARLLKQPQSERWKPAVGHDLVTFMETYAMSGGADSPGLDADVERAIEAGLQAVLVLIQGERHVEAFLACA